MSIKTKSDLFLLELPQYPNVDAFNFETMKKMLIEKLDSFNSAPFTIQRICELLADPRKQYSRIDKFMRAVEKTILVVSTQEPGRHRSESENGDSLDSALNGDFASEVNVEIDMDSENSFSTKDFSATTTANRKDTNHEVTTTTTKTTTALATDVSVGTVKAPETNGSSEKTTDAVPKTDGDAVSKTDGEEVKSEPATKAAFATEPASAADAAPVTEAASASKVAEVASVTSSDSAESKASSSNSDTEAKKDEDKSPIEEKAEEKPEVEAEEVAPVAEEEEPESIEEELPEEPEEDDEEEDDDEASNVGLGEIMVPVCDAVLPGACDTTSRLAMSEEYANMKEIIVTVSDPSVIAVVFPLAALESICKGRESSDSNTTTVKLEDFAQTSTRIITEDTTASDSPDESDSGVKRMKYTVSSICTRAERDLARAEKARNRSATTSTVVREEQQPQVGSTTTNTEDDEEEDKSQDSMSTSDAIPSTTEPKDPEVEAKPMNEEVPIECAEAVAVAPSSSSSIVLEMEASSSAAPVESKMSLDEDVTSEITEESATVIPINKMDTETEGDAMDVDESEGSSEPMDQ